MNRRQPTTDAERTLAIADAEVRLGRKLSAGEQRIDIVGIDRDLAAGKQALHEAVQAEQRRAADEYARTGQPIQLRVTDAMKAALSDLYDAGAAHAIAELEAAGITVE